MADDDQKMKTSDDSAVVQDDSVVVSNVAEKPQESQNEPGDSSPVAQNDTSVTPDENEIATSPTPRNDPSLTRVLSDNDSDPEPVADLNELELPAPAEEADDATSDSEEEVAEAQEEDKTEEAPKLEEPDNQRQPVIAKTEDPNAKWYVIHTFAGHENKVLTTLKQRVEAEHLENKIFDILVPTQDKIEIRGGKKETVKEKIFPGYILVKMILDDNSWLTVRTTQGVTSFIGAGNKPIPISEAEVASIVKFTTQGAAPTFKDVFMVDDTVKIVDGPFSDFIGKVDSVDKEKGRVRVLVSIFGRETPVELDFLQVQKL